ncbi:uncharacterized protein EI90DRAFT_2604015 [Cantharellus anzutake]|uniref:uncharacterized protein n=1 Tax=Cantharellus anzutake TaxID=1750568 RepID=UPI0019034815|nr:uncharacterized protein EI90DRAFT_2604015 [Cantharellus anzutake]KAF8320584.1 hypothetical protein EI90DRAFT_2604015 [Cantharellus anzutake]
MGAEQYTGTEPEDIGSILWTRSNVLLTSHPNLPQIHAQFISRQSKSFPLKKFDLPSPPVVATSAAFYKPPICIAVSSDDSHMFAFFPPSPLSVEGGVACVWSRGRDVATYTIEDSWKLERGNEVVASRWIGGERIWSAAPDLSEGRKLVRTPVKGPKTAGVPALILITKMMEAQLHLKTSYPPLIQGQHQNPSPALSTFEYP